MLLGMPYAATRRPSFLGATIDAFPTLWGGYPQRRALQYYSAIVINPPGKVKWQKKWQNHTRYTRYGKPLYYGALRSRFQETPGRTSTAPRPIFQPAALATTMCEGTAQLMTTPRSNPILLRMVCRATASTCACECLATKVPLRAFHCPIGLPFVTSIATSEGRTHHITLLAHMHTMGNTGRSPRRLLRRTSALQGRNSGELCLVAAWNSRKPETSRKHIVPCRHP